MSNYRKAFVFKAISKQLNISVGYHLPPKSWEPHFSPDNRPHIGEKVPLIALRQILLKTLLLGSTFSYIIMTYLKTFDETNSLNTKQCPAGLFPRVITFVSFFLPKICLRLMFLNCLHQLWTVPTSPKRLWEILRMAENLTQQPKICSLSPTRKWPLNKFSSSSIRNAIPSLIKQQFSFNQPIQASFVAVAIVLV